MIVADLDGLKQTLKQLLTDPKPAVQPGRRIATLRETANVTAKIAFMDPEPGPPQTAPAR